MNALFSALSSALLSLIALVGVLFPTGPQAPAPLPEIPVVEIASSTPMSQPESAATSSPASPAKSDTKAPAAAPTTSKPAAPQPATTPAIATPAAPTKSSEQINADTRAALVNILCTSQTGIHGISGSGIVIDSRGIVLTNAHIGQYFLLRNYLVPGNVDCVVRIGSPAQRMYTARLLYLPPAWIKDNASQLSAIQATGTGENDYAFLLITGRTDPSASLPSSFSSVALQTAYPDIGHEMLLAAYPAGFLSGELIEKSLYASSAVTYVTQLFSFDDNTSKVDLFSIGGTVVSQAGSSGGAVVRLSDGALAGLIATATTGSSTGARDLRAITLSHIDQSLATAGKGGIAALLAGDVNAKANEFLAQVAPGETAQLEAALKAQ